MARIVTPSSTKNNEWFEQVAPETFSEVDVEQRILLHASIVYPEFHVFSFKLTVESPYGNAKPDLIFIAKDYSDWWVCEVELGHHSFAAHVENQIQILTEAKYDTKEAKYICKKHSVLSLDKTLKLFKSVSAKVLVIVNEPKKEWISSLAKYGALLGVFELFRSKQNNEIFRVNGQYPSRYIKHISKCFVHPTAQRLLGVVAPGNLKLRKRGRITLKYNNCITEWQRIDADGQVWLSPVGQPFLEGIHDYEIYQQGDGDLVLRRIDI